MRSIGRLAARHDGLTLELPRSTRPRASTSQKDVESVEREEERVQRHLETLEAEAMELEAERARDPAASR